VRTSTSIAARGTVGLPGGQLSCDPGTSEVPVSLHSSEGNLKCFRSFGFAQAREETELDGLCGTRVQSFEAAQYFVDSEHTLVEFDWLAITFLEEQPDLRAPSLITPRATRVVDEHSPHLLRHYGEKVPTVLPLNSRGAAEPQVNFMHDRRRLQGVIAAFAAHVPGGSAAQLAVDDLDQPVAGVVVAGTPLIQEGRDWLRLVRHGSLSYLERWLR
jgi:hypothetical protein